MSKKSFREWFTKDYIMQANLSSPLVAGNKSISERQERICRVAEKILDEKNKTATIEQLRKEIVTEFFVTMRCSLDYINYAKLFIEVWKKSTSHVK